GVHRVVGAARIDGEPADAALEDPFGEGARRTRVADEVLRLVDVSAVAGPVLGIVAVVAGVDHQDLVALDPESGVLLPTLEMLRPIEVVVADPHPLQVDYARGPHQPLERKVADELAAAEEV